MLALISDIHGNLAALEQVLRVIDGMGVGRIVCLGDVAGYYPDVDACADILRARRIPTLKGNHDDYIARGIPCPRSDSANRCLEHQRRTIRQDTVDWLRSLPAGLRIDSVDLVHAGWNDPLDEYMVPSDAYFSGAAGHAFASGHSHVQYVWLGTDTVYCNPGSVGQPRDGDPRAAFATWDGTAFVTHRVAYDIDRTEQAMRDAGFSDYFFANLRQGSRIGGKVDRKPA